MAYNRYPEDDSRDCARNWDRDDGRERSRGRGRGRGLFGGDRSDRGPSAYDEDGSRYESDRPRGAYGNDHRARRGISYDETPDLIASSKVEGTPVYGRDDRRLGTVKALMIDKVEGQVRYAVLSHATGFLGLDEEVVPVRWEELRYDERRGGYRVDFTADDVAYTIENRRRDRHEGRNLDRDGRIRR